MGRCLIYIEVRPFSCYTSAFMSSVPVAVLDANVLYPAQLRDLLMRLSVNGLFRAHWSDEIHNEWMRNLVANRDNISWEVVERTRDLMDEALPGACVDGYKRHINRLSLPDPDDRHVLAAAIEIEAEFIVTCNLGDFPSNVLRQEGVDACHPDDFVIELYHGQPLEVIAVVKELRASLSKPPQTPEQLLDHFRRGGLKRVAKEMESYVSEI